MSHDKREMHVYIHVHLYSNKLVAKALIVFGEVEYLYTFNAFNRESKHLTIEPELQFDSALDILSTTESCD